MGYLAKFLKTSPNKLPKPFLYKHLRRAKGAISILKLANNLIVEPTDTFAAADRSDRLQNSEIADSHILLLFDNRHNRQT